MKKARIAIIGASGYSGEELLRILLRHPQAEIVCVTSRQHSGRKIGTLFPRFAECDLAFNTPSINEIAQISDVAFLALPHGLADEYALPLLSKGVKVIDISADFRIKDADVYCRTYEAAHPAPDLLAKAVYGLPERYRDRIRNAELVACPGCYPTSIILPCAPVLAAELVEDKIISCSASGVTGAGRKVELPYIFPECNESFRPYKVTGHRHVPEIEQELSAAAGNRPVILTFIPHLAPFSRGIHSTIIASLKSSTGPEHVEEALHQAYANEPFVRFLGKDGLADTKHVAYSNMCEIGFAVDKKTGHLILSSAIDNLTKGASGQAVQCMNIMYGFKEDCGLK